MKLLLTTLSLFVFAALPAWGQTYDAEFKHANSLYNRGDYHGAITAYRKAIQSDPTQAPPYRNLARAYFWIESYAAASAYYDFYLRLADGSTKDVDTISQERKLASERAGSSVHGLPSNQRQALNALTQALSTGAAYTKGGGGAWALYNTLLRTGFAEPSLIDLRANLTRRLVDEFDATLIPPPGAFAPVITLQGWQTQGNRLDAARQLAADPLMIDILNRRGKVVVAAETLLSGDYKRAAALSKTAAVANPDVTFLPWFAVVALEQSNASPAALGELKELARSLKSTPGLIEYATVLRAMILQNSGKSADAADVFSSVLND